MTSQTKMEFTFTQRGQLDRQLVPLRDSIPGKPKKGWIHEIRTALMMTSSQLARRLGLVQSSITRLEQSEQNDSISLKSLKKVAEALDCDFHYAFIPKNSLESSLYDRAEKLYTEEMLRLNHHMKLEAQETPQDTARRTYEILSRYDRVWDSEI